jgi:hypothetical protein
MHGPATVCSRAVFKEASIGHVARAAPHGSAARKLNPSRGVRLLRACKPPDLFGENLPLLRKVQVSGPSFRIVRHLGCETTSVSPSEIGKNTDRTCPNSHR